VAEQLALGNELFGREVPVFSWVKEALKQMVSEARIVEAT
jgi:hypothetical protein